MKYSERLGEISDDQLQKALDRFDLGILISSSIISGGLFGQNLFLTSSKGEFVLRGVPHYDWQFPSEKFYAELLHKHTSVPVPYPYLLDEDKSIFGWSYIIMPRMAGMNLSDNLEEPDLSDKDRTEIARIQGKTLVEAQKLCWDTIGTFNLTSKSILSFHTDYYTFLKTEISKWVNKARSYNSNTTEDDILWIEELLSETESLFKEANPVFVMRDYKPGNMVVDKSSGAWEITGLFDLMECYFGHEESDLARMFCVYVKQERTDLAHEFVKSYIQHKGNVNTEHLLKRFPLFLVLDRLIVWEWYQRKEKDLGVSFREWIQPYLVLELD